MLKQCKRCDKEFNAEHRRRKYCSTECAIAASITGSNKICPICNTQFWCNKARSKTYCSSHCADIGTRTTVDTICTICGKTYQRKQHQIKKGQQNYCSYECWLISGRTTVNCGHCNKSVIITKFYANYVKKTYCSKECQKADRKGYQIKCRKCDKLFYIEPNQLGRKFYCSQRCYHNGENTPFIIMIRNLILYRSWRAEVFKRDHNKCMNPDCPYKREGKVIIEAHHIKELSVILRQYNVKTIDDAIKCDVLWDLENGVTLCKWCHKKVTMGKLNLFMCV